MFSCLGYLEEGAAAATRRRQKNYERRVDITRVLCTHARIHTNIYVRFMQIKLPYYSTCVRRDQKRMPRAVNRCYYR